MTAGLLVTAGPARASGEGSQHFCEEFAPGDDGALTDPIHHSIEPLAPALHTTNCYLQANLERLSCVPGLEFLRSPSYVFHDLLCM